METVTGNQRNTSLREKLRETLNNRVTSETNPAQEKSRGGTPPLNIDFDREIKQPVALCFDHYGHKYVSTFTDTVYVV